MNEESKPSLFGNVLTELSKDIHSMEQYLEHIKTSLIKFEVLLPQIKQLMDIIWVALD